jgi:hypothetical protein
MNTAKPKMQYSYVHVAVKTQINHLRAQQIIFLAQPSHCDFGQVETFTTVAAPAEFQ